jgi:hypothetical protein
VTILGTLNGWTATIVGVAEQPGMQVTMLGDGKPLETKPAGGNLQVTLSEHLPGNYAYVLKAAGSAHGVRSTASRQMSNRPNA